MRSAGLSKSFLRRSGVFPVADVAETIAYPESKLQFGRIVSP
jgi:hypothetical protein